MFCCCVAFNVGRINKVSSLMGLIMVKEMHTCCGQYVPQEQECPLYRTCSLLVLILIV